MANQIKPSVTNPTIADIYQMVESGRLILKPDFQRKFVWTHEHQEEFLDTIRHGYPFPEIYVCQGEVDVAKLKTTQYVIDGQQRLTTIKRYIDGSHDREYGKVPSFSALTEDERREFLTYQIVVRDIGKVDDGTIREIFRRINLTKFKLDTVEIHNAVYDGGFIRTAKYILDEFNLKNYGVFHESEFTRMADLHFMLLVMSTIEHGSYYPQDNEIENYIRQYNDEYPGSQQMKLLMSRVFSTIDDLNIPEDSIWFRKSSFFTLVTELANHIDALPHDLRDRLLELERKILQNKNNSSNVYSKYYSYMYSATTGRKARVVRASLFNSDVLGIKEEDLISGIE